MGRSVLVLVLRLNSWRVWWWAYLSVFVAYSCRINICFTSMLPGKKL